MNLIITASTDKGLEREKNQDSLLAKQYRIEGHHVVAAIISDGMGGEVKGEIASSSVVKSFERWMDSELPILIRENATRDRLRVSWKRWLDNINGKLNAYGKKRDAIVGATAAVLLIIDDLYFVLNVGDSRIYQITSRQIKQITEDQTITALAVRRGDMTEEEAMNDDRQGILAQAVGMQSTCLQDLYAGRITGTTSFLMCTDGFRNKLSLKDIGYALNPEHFTDKNQMKALLRKLTYLCRERGETDNISALLIKAY